MNSTPENHWLAELWLQYRERLERLLVLRMPPVLQRRLSVYDLLQETYLACGRRQQFLQSEPEVPVYVKLRRIALQTITDMERHHLAAAKRDAMKERSPEDDVAVADAWAQFADTISSPRTHLEKLERQAMARRVLAQRLFRPVPVDVPGVHARQRHAPVLASQGLLVERGRVRADHVGA
jgi:hypothetical protein